MDFDSLISKRKFKRNNGVKLGRNGVVNMYNVRFYILFFTKLSIFSAVKGVRSTGLESNVYDVVITAGGFAKEKLFYKSL